MLVINVNFMEGTSKKTGKAYACHKISGIERDLYNGGLRCHDYMVSPTAYERNPVIPGMNIEVFGSGEIYIKDTNCFDLHSIEAVL